MREKAFTLVELLIVIAVIGLLAALSLAGFSKVLENVRVAGCASNMRQLGLAFAGYLTDHNGEFPRSFHSAGTHRQPGWAASIAPYLGIPDIGDPVLWAQNFNKFYRCPEHQEKNPAIYSYAMNVYFEMDPMVDSYPGYPETWRRMGLLQQPSQTILLAETHPLPFGDHIMVNFCSSPNDMKVALAKRHGGRLNFLFVDGSVRRFTPQDTFNCGVNLWHPQGIVQVP